MDAAEEGPDAGLGSAPSGSGHRRDDGRARIGASIHQDAGCGRRDGNYESTIIAIVGTIKVISIFNNPNPSRSRS